MEMVNELMDGLVDKYGGREGESYQALRDAFQVLFGQHRTQAGVMSRQIGGVYRDRSFIGQEGGELPFKPVPAETQKNAMENLNRYLFAPDAFHTSHDVYNYLQVQRRGFGFIGSNEYHDIHKMVLYSQLNILIHMMHPNSIHLIYKSILYGKFFTVSKMID